MEKLIGNIYICTSFIILALGIYFVGTVGGAGNFFNIISLVLYFIALMLFIVGVIRTKE